MMLTLIRRREHYTLINRLLPKVRAVIETHYQESVRVRAFNCRAAIPLALIRSSRASPSQAISMGPGYRILHTRKPTQPRSAPVSWVLGIWGIYRSAINATSVVVVCGEQYQKLTKGSGVVYTVPDPKFQYATSYFHQGHPAMAKTGQSRLGSCREPVGPSVIITFASPDGTCRRVCHAGVSTIARWQIWTSWRRPAAWRGSYHP
jgi:hypothetical protein